jgi:hypothetical protein
MSSKLEKQLARNLDLEGGFTGVILFAMGYTTSLFPILFIGAIFLLTFVYFRFNAEWWTE